MKIGDRVILRVPGNPRLDGTEASVAAFADWGAHVLAPAAATGAFRAAWSEMEPVARRRSAPTGDVCDHCGGVNMVRSGSCLTCQNCGSTSGCG